MVGLGVWSLFCAGVGFFNDVAWHVGRGRDEELFTAPHTMIVLGLGGIALAAALGIVVATFTGAAVGFRVGQLPRAVVGASRWGCSAVRAARVPARRAVAPRLRRRRHHVEPDPPADDRWRRVLARRRLARPGRGRRTRPRAGVLVAAVLLRRGLPRARRARRAARRVPLRRARSTSSCTTPCSSPGGRVRVHRLPLRPRAGVGAGRRRRRVAPRGHRRGSTSTAAANSCHPVAGPVRRVGARRRGRRPLLGTARRLRFASPPGSRSGTSASRASTCGTALRSSRGGRRCCPERPAAGHRCRGRRRRARHAYARAAGRRAGPRRPIGGGLAALAVVACLVLPLPRPRPAASPPHRRHRPGRRHG